MLRQSDPEKCIHGPEFDYTRPSITRDIHFTPDNPQYVQLCLEGVSVFNHASKDLQTKLKTSR